MYYIYNRKWVYQTKLDNKILTIDKETQDVDTATIERTLAFYVKKDELEDTLEKVKEGNYLLTSSSFFNITTLKATHYKEVSYFELECEGIGGYDLLNEALQATTKPSSAQKIEYYINNAIYDSGFEIGLNESTTTQSLEFTEVQTPKERILAILSAFKMEMNFRFDIQNNQVKHKYIDIVKQVGSDKTDVYYVGKEIESISVSRNTASIVTGLRATGGTPENGNDAINLNGYKLTIAQAENGRFVLNGGKILDTESNAKWSRYLVPSEKNEGDEGYIIGKFEGSQLTQSALATATIAALKERSKVIENYEVEFAISIGVEIGDRISCVHEKSKLFISSRVLTIERDFLEGKTTLTLGEEKLIQSNLSYELVALANELNQKYGAISSTQVKFIRSETAPDGSKYIVWVDTSRTPNVQNNWDSEKQEWVRVTPVTPDEVGAFGYESGVALTDQVNNIQIDTSQLQADAEEMRANAEQIRLDMQKAREELEADLDELQEDVDAKNSDMTQLINSNKVDTDKVLADANTAIVDANKKIAATDENVTNINTSITNINNELATKVEKEDVNVLKQTVTNQATSIKQNSDLIALKADSETVDALNDTVSNQATLIEQNAKAIALKANSVDVDAVKKTVTAHDSKITQTAEDITSLVTKTDDTNTALSEIKQTADAITTKIGAIEEDADSTSTKLSTLEQNVSSFKTTVSNTYETISNVDTKANKAKNDAISSAKTETASQVKQMSDSITQTVAEKYPTKDQVASQISQKADSITQTVASQYQPKGDYATTGYVASQIKQTSDSITSTISTNMSNTYSTKSETQSKVNAVQANVDKLGTNIAYAWSKDGKDRFTRVKPNEVFKTSMFVNGTKSKIGDSNFITMSLKAFTSYTASTGYDSMGNWSDIFLVASGQSASTPVNGVNKGMDRTITTKADGLLLIGFRNNAEKGINIDYNMSIYEGAIAYPSSEFDYDNAVPRYIGRSLKDSTNPADFTWEPNPERKPWTSYAQGLNGEGLSLMPYGENLILGTASPFTITGDNTSNQGYTLYKFAKASFKDFGFKEGDLVTLSFDWSTTASSGSFRPEINTTPWSYGSVLKATGTNGDTYYGTDISSSKKSGTVTLNYRITSESAVADTAYPKVRFDYLESGKTFTIKNYKLEVSNLMNIPTPWTPAPSEDPLGAIPKYVGTAALPYEDFSKYTWDLNPAWLNVNTETLVSNQYSQSVQDLDGFKNTVGTTYQTKDAMTGYYNKAETNSQINQKAGEITSTVSSTYTTKSDFNTGINNAATDATTKANNALASAKTDATNKANDAKSQAVSLAKTETTSQVKQLSDSITSTVSKVEEKVDGIQIGGRNYLLKTATAIEKEANVPNSYVTFDPYNLGANTTLSSLGFKEGDTFTLSFEWEIRNSANNPVYGNFRIEIVDKAGVYIAPIKLPVADFSKSKSGKEEITFTTTGSTINGSKIRIRIDNSVLILKVSKMKLEQGNKATDWTPAPEDVDANIDSALTTSKEYTNSQIQQTANSITSTVSQKVGKSEVISTINQSAESVTINASKINLQGALTISQFSTSDRDKINNGISTANTAKTNASTAQTRADNAYNLANTANGTANTAKTNAGNAWDYANTVNTQVNSWKKSGTTKIDGGNIYADSLSVISSNMGILETYYNSDWNGKLRIEGATIRGFMNTNSKLLEKSRYYPDAIEYYTHDSSGNWLNSFRLDPNGIANSNVGYGKRTLAFFSEGLAIAPGSNNTGVTKNSGIRLLGSTSYVDLFSDKSSSGADYSTRLIAESNGNGGINNNKGQFYINANSIALNTNVGVTGTLSMNGYSIVGARNTIGTTGTGGWEISMMNIQGITGTPYLNVTSGSRSWGVTMWSSDMKLKKNIQKTTGKAIDIVDKLMVRQFDWRDSDRHTDYGLIAQNVEKVLPQAVFEVEQKDKPSIKQLSPEGLIPVLVQAIQELKQEINELKNTK